MTMSTSAPEPPATAAPSAAVGEAQPRQPFAPLRVGAGLLVGTALWLGPFAANNGVLLPARLSFIAPDQKVALVALLSIVGSIVALLANVIFGALSDLTRSRFGRRAPWMVVGSLGASASLFALANADTVPAIVVLWCLFQLFLNSIAAPLLATLADRVPTTRRGTYSGLVGVGTLLGAAGFTVGASAFVDDPGTGMAVTAVLVLLAGPVAALLFGERSSRDLPRRQFSAQTIAASFTFPSRQARDFYLALSGKLLFNLGLYSILGYLLYILTDHIGLSLGQAGSAIAVLNIITLVTALVMALVCGPLSDRLGRRKVLVIGAAVVVAVGMVIPFFVPTLAGMFAFAVVAGLGAGAYNSVDQALNTEVLPNDETAAKDLGILNMANTGGQIIGPGVTSLMVGITGGYGPVFVAAAAIVVIGILPLRAIRSVR